MVIFASKYEKIEDAPLDRDLWGLLLLLLYGCVLHVVLQVLQQRLHLVLHRDPVDPEDDGEEGGGEDDEDGEEGNVDVVRD